MRLTVYVTRRLLILLPTLIGVTLITFVLVYAPGTQRIIAEYCNPKAPGGCTLGSAQVQDIVSRLHLRDPLPVQYVYYLNSLIHGDWGYTTTYANGVPVMQAIAFLFPSTVELAITSTVVAIILGIPTGTISAIRKDKLSDHISRVVALSGYAIPTFWLAILLQLLAVYLDHENIVHLPISLSAEPKLLDPAVTPWMFASASGGPCVTPYSGCVQFSSPTHFLIIDAALNGNWPIFWDAVLHIILPVLTLGFGIFGVILRMVRSGMVDSMNQDYVRTAWAKGLPESVVIRKHIRRNAMLPTTTVIGLLFAGLLGGVVLVEYVFQWPGIGGWAAQSVLAYDPGGVLGTTLLFALFLMLTNLVVDIIYAYLDPRISL